MIGQSIWPVLLSIASLPPKIRMNVDYLLLAGIWLGSVKPDMKLILQPIAKKIESLDIPLQTSEGTKHLKAKLLLGFLLRPWHSMLPSSMESMDALTVLTRVHTLPTVDSTYLLTIMSLEQCAT